MFAVWQQDSVARWRWHVSWGPFGETTGENSRLAMLRKILNKFEIIVLKVVPNQIKFRIELDFCISTGTNAHAILMKSLIIWLHISVDIFLNFSVK